MRHYSRMKIPMTWTTRVELWFAIQRFSRKTKLLCDNFKFTRVRLSRFNWDWKKKATACFHMHTDPYYGLSAKYAIESRMTACKMTDMPTVEEQSNVVRTRHLTGSGKILRHIEQTNPLRSLILEMAPFATLTSYRVPFNRLESRSYACTHIDFTFSSRHFNPSLGFMPGSSWKSHAETASMVQNANMRKQVLWGSEDDMAEHFGVRLPLNLP